MACQDSVISTHVTAFEKVSSESQEQKDMESEEAADRGTKIT